MAGQVPSRTPGADIPFEIGLVMAGAISAGAYTAGFMDFLIQALDEWEAAKKKTREELPGNPNAGDCPMHDVRIKVMAGSSAGGMTAAIAAGQLGMDFEPVLAQPSDDKPITPRNNKLYQSWVNTVDIVPLLGTDDIDANSGSPVQSMLDSTILRTIARDSLTFDSPGRQLRRPYVHESLHVILTVTNLRGVPYTPTFANVPAALKLQKSPKMLQYEMTLHADNMHFVLGAEPAAADDAIWLKPYDFTNSESWGVLKDAALATGAFPVGLAPQLLKRTPRHYASRRWPIPGPHDDNGKHRCEHWEPIRPNWPAVDQAVVAGEAAGKPYSYEFLCVDGGVMNNEPLDYARQVLNGTAEAEASAGDQATRAVIMVMPFPNGAAFSPDYDGKTGLVKLLTTTFNALISQARFKPQELALANDPSVYSRFLVVPRRGFRPDGTLEPDTIACGSLGGFGGFLSRRFREHDYQLGRRNCQWFLKQYFALPSEGALKNKLFDNWSDAARDKHKICIAVKGGLPEGATTVLPILPIIPLVGTAATTVPEPRWPEFSELEFEALRPKVKSRLTRVVGALVNHNVEGRFWGPFARGALKSAWWLQKGSVVDSVMKTIRTDLTNRKLMASNDDG